LLSSSLPTSPRKLTAPSPIAGGNKLQHFNPTYSLQTVIQRILILVDSSQLYGLF
ncbi:hypothetical protein NDU88_006750, partial [Pleurodeles waltl]